MQRQILATLAYSDVFSFPLTAKEVFQRLVTTAVVDNAIPHKERLKDDSSITFSDICKTLEQLVAEQKITSAEGYFSLRKQKEAQELVAIRKKRMAIADEKWQEAWFAVGILKKIPGVVGIAVTGALAANNPASKTDDIDFLIVTKSDMLWIVRPLVTLVAFVCGKRRSWQGEEQNSWCFNVWMSAKTLALSDIYPDFEPNLYHAYELLQAVWQVNNGVSLIEANPWVSFFVSEKRWGRPNESKAGSDRQTAGIWKLVNRWLFKAQLKYMKPHMTIERVSYEFAFFHPRPTKTLTMNSWEKIFNKKMGEGKALSPWSLPAALQKKIQQVKKNKQKVVLATGVFDMLHSEHRNFLKNASNAGDFLLVGVETDARVKKMKGEDRPVHGLQKRIKALEVLPYVDAVFALPEAFSKPVDHDGLIAAIRPHVLAVSSHSDHLDKKQAILEKYGGSIAIVHQHNPDVSTTRLITHKKTM
jgi:rfaE bifunctional protein nucleotidyltransferase chain/domain